MAPMPATHGHSEACCNIPPVVAKGYTPKGDYQQLGGYKTYVTGPADADKAIIVIYDIFGFFDQTLQGADILAYADEGQKYRVLIPDWFKGEPIDISGFPPDTDEKKAKLAQFLESFSPAATAAALPDYVAAVKAKMPSLGKFAILGFCWGGKVATLTAGSAQSPFAAAAAAHPAMVEPADAEKVSIPLALLASQDEPAEVVKQFEDKLSVAKHVEIFADQIHGWMAARANLADDRVKSEYVRGYKTVLRFFGQHV